MIKTNAIIIGIDTAGFQPIMAPVKNDQMSVYKPSPCPIVITVIDLANNEKETMRYIAML